MRQPSAENERAASNVPVPGRSPCTSQARWDLGRALQEGIADLERRTLRYRASEKRYGIPADTRRAFATGITAEDVVQETLLAALAGEASFADAPTCAPGSPGS